MKEQVYIDRLFEGYENTPELQDFKEEIAVNLQERIKGLQAKGMSEEDAFEKATAELGDVTEVADELSRQKRNEVIGKMYMYSQKTKIGKIHALGYVLCAGAILFGIIAAAIAFSVNGDLFTSVATLLPFIIPAGTALVFLGLTQETTRNLPMSWKRALIYGLTTGVTLFGLCTSALLYFMEGAELTAVLGTLLPFVLPGLCLITFMILTEKNRQKPWVAQELGTWMENHGKDAADPRRIEQRGLLSGALWLLSIALFVALGFLIGFQYSWVVFLFSIAGELVIEFWVRSKTR